MEITDYPNYLIYPDGRVYSKNVKRFLKEKIGKYYTVSLCKEGKSKTFSIHRLVALHYLPLVEDKDMIDHIDRDKTNNNVSNLRWCNRSENNINTDTYKNNKLGHKHINKTASNTYKFQIIRNGKRHTKNFKTLEECIEYRDNYLSTL